MTDEKLNEALDKSITITLRELNEIFKEREEKARQQEKERIIEMIEKNFGFPPTSTKPKEICISESEWKQFKTEILCEWN